MSHPAPTLWAALLAAWLAGAAPPVRRDDPAPQPGAAGTAAADYASSASRRIASR